MKNLLLVGASGFLGQHLKDFYQKLGWNVFSLGRSLTSDYVFDSDNLDSIFELDIDVSINRIINAAAINEVDINNNISNTYNVNVTLTRYLMELANKLNIPEFIYISTFHVYGRTAGEINSNSSCDPKNDYGLTHYLSEKVVSSMGKSFGVNTLIVRPTNIYGCPVNIESFNRWTLVPFDFVRSAAQQNAIVIKSSGLQKRNFVSVSDVLFATLLVEELDIVNAYGIDTLSIREFALTVAKTLNKHHQLKVNVSWLNDEESNVEELSFTHVDLYAPKENIENYILDFYGLLK